MKKRFIVPIVLSSIGLLIGGLIYLGISSFPELLESEKSVKKEANRAIFVDDTVIVESDKLFEEEPVIVSGGGAACFVDYIPSSANISEIEYVDAPSTVKETKVINRHTNASSYNDFSIVIEDILPAAETHFEIEATNVIVENTEVKEDHFYGSTEISDGVHTQPKVKKARVNKNQKMRSNEALVETSLLVIGAVDIFSMILIHRKKHLFH